MTVPASPGAAVGASGAMGSAIPCAPGIAEFLIRTGSVVDVTGSLCIGLNTVVVGPALGAMVATDL